MAVFAMPLTLKKGAWVPKGLLLYPSSTGERIGADSIIVPAKWEAVCKSH